MSWPSQRTAATATPVSIYGRPGTRDYFRCLAQSLGFSVGPRDLSEHRRRFGLPRSISLKARYWAVARQASEATRGLPTSVEPPRHSRGRESLGEPASFWWSLATTELGPYTISSPVPTVSGTHDGQQASEMRQQGQRVSVPGVRDPRDPGPDFQELRPQVRGVQDVQRVDPLGDLVLVRLNDILEPCWSVPVTDWEDALSVIQSEDPAWMGVWVIKQA